MRTSAWLLLLACGTAEAEEAAPGVTVRAPRRWQEPGPLLHLDFILPANTEGLGATTEREAYVLELGSSARLAVQGEWWKSTLSPQALQPDDLDDVSRGWRASYELSYDLGPFRLGGSMTLGHVDGRFERGTYRAVGVSASRTLRLSRWMLAWISLGVGRQQWLGAPPPGEANRTTVMLRIGTTFR